MPDILTAPARTPRPAGLDWLAGTGPGRPQIRRCTRCNTWTLYGTTIEPCGIPYTATWTPLDRQGEIAAIILGVPTFTLTRPRTHAVIDTRNTPRSIRHHPPGGPAPPWRLYDVIPAHRCDHNLQMLAVASRLTSPPERTHADECPY